MSMSDLDLADEVVEAGARAVAIAESWSGWDNNSATPNGNDPEEQRAWCREVAVAVLKAALPIWLSQTEPPHA